MYICIIVIYDINNHPTRLHFIGPARPGAGACGQYQGVPWRKHRPSPRLKGLEVQWAKSKMWTFQQYWVPWISVGFFNGTWRFILLEEFFGVSAFQWFQEFQVFHVIWQCDTAKWDHPQPWESENVSSPSFWELRIFARVLWKFAGFCAGNSNVFGGSFHFAQPLDIQLPFQTQWALGVSSVWRQSQSPSFSESQQVNTKRSQGFFQDFESPGNS